MKSHEANIREEDLRDLHDAELVSLALDRAARHIDLVVSMVNGTHRRFECDGVLNIKCSTLLFQNVVYRMFVTPITPLKFDETRRFIAWSFTLDDKMAISSETLDAHVDNVMAGKLKLLHVTPSWGAELSILCGSVVLRSA